MKLKYNLVIDDQAIQYSLKRIINQIYKLLPIREQGDDWEKPLYTILEELIGMQKLMNGNYSEIYFPLLSKLEGLYSLTRKQDFLCYRRTIFECLSLVSELEKKICHQIY